MGDEFKETFELVEKIMPLQRELVHQTVAAYQPEVNAIVSNKIKDEHRIEQALTWMLDAAFDEQVLQLYKKLCRYYYFINPEVAVRYIHYYREMWDEEYQREEELIRLHQLEQGEEL